MPTLDDDDVEVLKVPQTTSLSSDNKENQINSNCGKKEDQNTIKLETAVLRTIPLNNLLSG